MEAEKLWDGAVPPDTPTPCEKKEKGEWTCGVRLRAKLLSSESIESHQISTRGYNEEKNPKVSDIEGNDRLAAEGDGLKKHVFASRAISQTMAKAPGAPTFQKLAGASSGIQLVNFFCR